MKRTFVIGDIHGCFDELIELIEKIGLKEEDILISLGDIVDRGNKSKAVYEYFRNRPNAIVLNGNHERKHSNGILSYAQEIVKVQFDKDYESFLSWLNSLEYYYETENAIIVHAAFEHDKALKLQREDVLCGSTSGERYLENKYESGKYWSDYYNGERTIIYGHHVVGEKPLIRNNTYGIDTGCCHGGFLTAIELPGFKIHQVASKKDYWKDEQIQWQIPVLASKDWDNMEITAIKKQLEKLSYIENEEVRQFLSSINNWVKQLEALNRSIKEKLDLFTADLINKHQENFSIEANKFPFKTFLFKSRSHNLKIEDIEKALNTPYKIRTLAEALNIEDLPTR